MADISRAVQHEYQMLMSRVPVEVSKAISGEEMADRLARAKSLMASAAAASDPALRNSYATMARNTLAAQPRGVTESQVSTLIAKAAKLESASPEAKRLRHAAQELLERHPPAPRQADRAAIAKARATRRLRVAVYDQRHRLAGIVDPAAIVQRVAKAGKSGEKTPMQPVFDQKGNLVGIVDPEAIMPVTGAGKPASDDTAGIASQAADAVVAKALRSGHADQFTRAFREGWRASRAQQSRRAPRRRTGR
jgi:hypothetical protein